MEKHNFCLIFFWNMRLCSLSILIFSWSHFFTFFEKLSISVTFLNDVIYFIILLIYLFNHQNFMTTLSICIYRYSIKISLIFLWLSILICWWWIIIVSNFNEIISFNIHNEFLWWIFINLKFAFSIRWYHTACFLDSCMSLEIVLLQ